MNALTILPSIIGPISDVIARLIPDPNKRIELEHEVTKTLMSNQAALLDAMKSVMVADAQSEGWLTRNARPLVVIWALCMLTWVGVIAPSLGIGNEAIKAISSIPDSLWNLVTVGIGGYMIAKTVESAATTIAGKGKQ